MPKVLVIGWDAADWKVIDPLIEAGQMPTLNSLIESGIRGKITTLDPPLSPTLWTSIATGKRPYKHGIHGFTEPDPNGKGIRPIFSTSRKCKAIWNILTQNKQKTHVVGWWPSHPAEPINGTMISNFFQRPNKGQEKQWKLPNGAIHPVEKADFFAKLRLHPNEITANHIAQFVPNFEKVDQKNDPRLFNIAKFLADASTIHNAATYILEHEEWDFMAVYYDAIDHFCHGFMKYHPPRREHISVQDYELYKDVVESAYRFHDMMLARLLELAGDDVTVILLSDHGFHPNHNRPKEIPKEPTGPAIEHSPYGILVMKGEGIKKDETIHGASLLDITPTLLQIFGLPIALDMDGKVLVNAFENELKIETIQSWENIKGEDGSHKTSLSHSFEETQIELQQLIELGYIADPGENLELAIKNTLDENNFNLSRAYLNGQQWEQGIALLEKLHHENPTVLRFATYLLNAYQSVGKFKNARKLLDDIKEVLDRESPQIDLIEGLLLLAENRPIKALELFQKVEKEAGNQPQLQLKIANAYLQLNKFEMAESVLEKALDHDPEDAGLWYCLGTCRYQMAKYEQSIDAILHAIGLQYYHPPSHFYLGENLLAIERYEDAVAPYEVCLRLAPAMNMARERLISIFEQFLGQPGKANKYKLDFEKSIKGELIIVSGLPRSGTSMMMQILQAGGLEIFTDNERKADESNQKGYFEHELVKNLEKNKNWLPLANGKVVKIIAQLLAHLPHNFKYKIIFMERKITEIISSQQKMLKRDGKNVNLNSMPLELLTSYEKTVKNVKKWAKAQSNVEIHFVHYDSVIENPLIECIGLKEFLSDELNIDGMLAAIDITLRREFKSTI